MAWINHLIKLLAGIHLAATPDLDFSTGRSQSVGVQEIYAPGIIVVQGAGGAGEDRARVPATAMIFDSEEKPGGTLSLDFTGRAEISARGNSSFYLPKKSFRLELQDEDGRDRKAPLLGLPSDSDWVLHSCATDRTFARNILAHELWRATERYAVRWRFVELFLMTNSTSRANWVEIAAAMPKVLDNLSSTTQEGAVAELHTNLVAAYRGVYVVFEKIKRGKNRVNIARLGPGDEIEPDVTGGYIIKKDDETRGERGVLTGQELKLRFEEPKERELTDVQRQWMTQHLEQFEKTLYSQKFRDAERGYSSFVDVNSFIDFHWMVEISKNADGYWLSQCMHKDRGNKLTMGPLWDWDNTFGNPFFGMYRTNGWRFDSATDPDYAWYRRLFEDPDFLQDYSDRWSELRTNVLSDAHVFAIINRVANSVRSGVIRDENRWLRRGPVPLRVRAGITFDDEIGGLKRWISGRLAWIDSQSFPKPVVDATRSDQALTLKAAWLHGRCFYTLDGSDPRARGGGVSQAAKEYIDPVKIRGVSPVTFRVRSQFGLWSAPVVCNITKLNERGPE